MSLYSSDGKSLCGDVLDSVNMSYWDVDSILDQIYELIKIGFQSLLLCKYAFFW